MPGQGGSTAELNDGDTKSQRSLHNTTARRKPIRDHVVRKAASVPHSETYWRVECEVYAEFLTDNKLNRLFQGRRTQVDYERRSPQRHALRYHTGRVSRHTTVQTFIYMSRVLSIRIAATPLQRSPIAVHLFILSPFSTALQQPFLSLATGAGLRSPMLC